MNIKNVMMMAAMMPAVALAETNSNSAPVSVEANDTTIRVNDQNIVIKQDGEQTSVKIYKMNGNEMTKISETQFVDGQEVEKVFVTSPFIPQTLSKRKRSLESHYPTFFFGCSQLPGSRGSMEATTRCTVATPSRGNGASPSPVSASAFPTKWRSPPLFPSDRYTTISRTIMY